MAVVSVVLHLQPLVLLMQQAAILPLLATSRDFCAAPLLTDPLTQQRLSKLWGLLQVVPLMPMPPLLLHGTATQAGTEPSESDTARLQCLSVFTWHLLMLGAVVPVVVAACRVPLGAARHQQRHGQQQAQEEQQEQQQEVMRRRPDSSVLKAAVQQARRAAAAAGRAWQHAEHALHEGCHISVLQLGAAMYMTAGICWMLSIAVAVAVVEREQ